MKNANANVNLRSIRRQILFQDHSYALVVNVDIIEVSEMEKNEIFSTLDDVRDTINDYEQIRKKLPPGMADSVAHIFSEVGELYQNIRNRETGTKILEELVDVILTTLQIANDMNFTTEDIFKAIEEKKIALDERISVFHKKQRGNE